MGSCESVACLNLQDFCCALYWTCVGCSYAGFSSYALLTPHDPCYAAYWTWTHRSSNVHRWSGALPSSWESCWPWFHRFSSVPHWMGALPSFSESCCRARLIWNYPVSDDVCCSGGLHSYRFWEQIWPTSLDGQLYVWKQTW